MAEDKKVPNMVCDSDPGISLLQQLTPLAKKINCLDIDRIAKICIENIPRLVGVKFASLYLLDDDTNILHLREHNHSFPINKIVSLNQDPPSPMVMSVRSNELILVGDINTHRKPVIKWSQRPFADNYKGKSCAIAPLTCQQKVVGVLNLAEKLDAEKFNCRDTAVIELFRHLIGASIGNIKLFEKTQKQAKCDGLTGLANYNTFYEVLEKELWRARRYGGRISLIMVDIDNLKWANDIHGHQAGDTVIREISKRIKRCIRQSDTAARYGGDEFVIVLPNTALSEATVVARRMVEIVNSSQISWKQEQIGISISVGLGEYGPDASPEEITSRSDHALYMAKRAGKNTFKIFE